MSSSSRGWHALSALSKQYPRVCAQCAKGKRIQPVWPRMYSAAAEAASAAPPAPPPVSETTAPLPPRSVVHPKSIYTIRSGLILTRAPLLTREPSPFEAAFFLYQKRLNERLASPFLKDLYFKQDTPPALDWALKLKERRGTVAKEIGKYRSKGTFGWNDEIPLGSELAGQEKLREQLVADGVMRFSDDGELLAEQDRIAVDKPMPRRTEADEKGDVRRLDRALDRTLYFVVRNPDGTWSFPSTDMPTDETMHETAARVLEEAAGVNINTWMVGRVPVAHHVVKPVYSEEDPTKVRSKGSKTFFLKARILAGQAEIKDSPLGITDFKWLTTEELKKEVPFEYYLSIRGMLADR